MTRLTKRLFALLNFISKINKIDQSTLITQLSRGVPTVKCAMNYKPINHYSCAVEIKQNISIRKYHQHPNFIYDV